MADVIGSLNQATAKKKVAKKPVAAFDALSVLGNALNAAPPVKRKPLMAQPVAGTRVDGVLNETTGQLTAKPLMAQPVPGTSANGLKNEATGEVQNAQGQKVKRYNLALENGVNLSFDSNRELTPDELQQTVNDIADREEFKKLEKVAAAKKKGRSQMATPNVGPYSNQTIAENNQRHYEQMMGPDGLAIAKKMTPQQIQSLPIEVRRSLQSRMIGGMNKDAQGLLEGAAKVGPRAAEWVGMGIQDIIDPNVLKPSDYSMAEGLKPEAKAKMAPAAKVVEAGANVGSYFLPYVGQMRGAVDTANIAQRIASGDGQQVVKETLDGLNVFDPNIDPLERGLRAINVMGAVYGGYHLSKGVAKGAQAVEVSKQLKISVPEALKIVNWAEEASAKAPKRTGINKAGRDDAKGTAASIALGNYEPPVAAGRGASNVPIPTTIQKPEMKPAPTLNIPGKQGPQPATFEPTVSTESKLGNPNEKTINEGVRDVQEGQGIRNEGKQFQGQGNGQKANAFVQEKGQVTPESVGVKSGMQDPHAGKTGVWKGPDADQPIKIEKTLGTKDGRTYVKVEGSNTGIPLDEITVDAPKPSGTRTRASKAEPTPVAPTAGEPNTVAVANADTAESRARMGMEERTKPATEPVASVVDTANKTYNQKVVDAKIDRHLGNPKKNILSREDTVQVRRRADELENEYGTAKARLDSAKTTDEISAATDDIERIKARHVSTINALESTGTETARTLNARRAILNKDDYSFEGLIRSKKAALKRDLTSDEINIERAAADEFKKASADLDRVRQEAYAAGRKAAEDELASTIAKERATIAKRAARKPQIQQKRSDIMARMKRVGIQDQAEALGTQKLYTLATDIKDLAKTYIEEGVNGLDDLTKKVTADMRANGLDIDDSEFIDVFRGAVKKSPGKDRVLSELQKLKKEANALARERANSPDAKKTAFENRLDARIAEYEKRLEAGDVEVKRRNNPKYDEFQAKELRLKTLQRRVDMERKKLMAQREYEDLHPIRKAGKQIAGVLGVPRTLFSSVDFSAPGRQNWFNFIAHPDISVKALVPQFQSLTRGGYENAAAAIRRNKDFDLANNSGLHLSTEALDHGEEMFVNKHLSRAWEIAGRDFNPVAASERAYSGYLSTVRMNLFHRLANDYRRAGVPITKDISEAIARHVNITTGRGVGWSGDTASKLSSLGFAPRYTVSKFQVTTANSLRSAIQRGDTVAMKRIGADYLKVLGTVGTMAGLTINLLNEKGSPVKTEWRANATNFGKAQYKDVTVDMLGGQQEVIRLLAKLKDGSITTSGKEKDLSSDYDWTKDRAMTLWYYLNGKAAPSISLSTQISAGEGFGKTMDPKTPEGRANIAKRMLAPGVIQTADELMANPKLTVLERWLLTGLSVGGFGVNDQSSYRK